MKLKQLKYPNALMPTPEGKAKFVNGIFETKKQKLASALLESPNVVKDNDKADDDKADDDS